MGWLYCPSLEWLLQHPHRLNDSFPAWLQESYSFYRDLSRLAWSICSEHGIQGGGEREHVKEGVNPDIKLVLIEAGTKKNERNMSLKV